MANSPVFEPAWNFTPALARPARPVLPFRYSNEKAAERALEALLEPYFRLNQELFRQVRITETGYPPQFIDYVALMPESASIKCIGIEVKRGFDGVKDANAAIRQAMRYRKARISDARLSNYLGDHLPFVLLWPEFRWDRNNAWCANQPNPDLAQAVYTARCEGEARALAQFAQHFNVGHVVFEPWWSQSSREWENGVTFMNGQQQVWTSRYLDTILGGLRAGAVLAGQTKRGMRLVD